MIALEFLPACGRSSCRRSLKCLPLNTPEFSPSPQKSLPRRQFHSSRSLSSSSSSSSRQITYRIAACSSGKSNRFHPSHNVYPFDPARHDALGIAYMEERNPILRRRKRPDSGEDAFFVSKIGHGDHSSSSSFTSTSTGAVAFGVADGVGGWVQSRVDPGDFSHGLCGYMAQTALRWEETPEKLRARNLLEMGYNRVVEDKSIVAGGSTASVGIGLSDGRVDIANLGDSFSLHLRLAAINHYSHPQTHAFNTPYQLSIIPPRMAAQASIFGGDHVQDFPHDAAVTNIHMQHGDVLVLATDGVSDNLNNQGLLNLVTKKMVLTGAWTGRKEDGSGSGSIGIEVSKDLDTLTSPSPLSSPKEKTLPDEKASTKEKTPDNTTSNDHAKQTLQSLLATTIVHEAKRASHNFRRDGPFAKEAQRYFPSEWFHGGKVDDICVLVLVAVDEGLC